MAATREKQPARNSLSQKRDYLVLYNVYNMTYSLGLVDRYRRCTCLLYMIIAYSFRVRSFSVFIIQYFAGHKSINVFLI